jgi:ATP-dependent protease ClpP protease subunit
MVDKIRYDQIQSGISRSVSEAQSDIKGRRQALARLERGGIRVAVYWSRIDRPLTRADVLPFANMLKSIGQVGKLDLIVVSPGGDGTVAETILHLCRKYCDNQFRVAIPAFAKSAATLMALGADEIVMGESSEIGPIDAQVLVMQDSTEQQVSADHFLRARNQAIANLNSPERHVVQAAQIQLSLLSPAFLKFCEDSMQFAGDFAEKQLRTHMFRAEYPTDSPGWDQRIASIISNLTSSSKHLTHGRMITSQHIRTDTDLQHLKVRDLPSDDSYWVALNELLLRTEIIAQQMDVGKILFAKDFELYGS